MDLAKLDVTDKSENGVIMQLRHPVTREEVGIELLLRGATSKTVKTAAAKFRQVMDNDRASDAVKEQAAADLAVKCIIDIRGAVYNGEEIASDDAGKRFLVEKFDWIAVQIFEFINELENFLPDSNSN